MSRWQLKPDTLRLFSLSYVIGNLDFEVELQFDIHNAVHRWFAVVSA